MFHCCFQNERSIMMEDYLNIRCCMCPNIQKDTLVCPGIPGTPHPEESACRFVKRYIDARGWKYKVRAGIGMNTFKAAYQKPEKHGDTGWKGVASLPWRETFDEAQADLNRLADAKGWDEWNE